MSRASAASMTSRGWSVSSAAQSPGTMSGARAVSRDPKVLERLEQRRRRDRPPAPHREHERTAVAEFPRRVENLHGAAAQWDPVLALRLHPQGRQWPNVVRRVNLGPLCPTYLARPHRGQHQKLERQLDGRLRRSRPHRPNGYGPRPCEAVPAGAFDIVLRTDRMRWRTARAASVLTCQIGVRISSMSAVLTSERAGRRCAGTRTVQGCTTNSARATGRASRRASVREHAPGASAKVERFGRGACRPTARRRTGRAFGRRGPARGLRRARRRRVQVRGGASQRVSSQPSNRNAATTSPPTATIRQVRSARSVAISARSMSSVTCSPCSAARRTASVMASACAAVSFASVRARAIAWVANTGICYRGSCLKAFTVLSGLPPFWGTRWLTGEPVRGSTRRG